MEDLVINLIKVQETLIKLLNSNSIRVLEVNSKKMYYRVLSKEFQLITNKIQLKRQLKWSQQHRIRYSLIVKKRTYKIARKKRME